MTAKWYDSETNKTLTLLMGGVLRDRVAAHNSITWGGCFYKYSDTKPDGNIVYRSDRNAAQTLEFNLGTSMEYSDEMDAHYRREGRMAIKALPVLEEYRAQRIGLNEMIDALREINLQEPF